MTRYFFLAVVLLTMLLASCSSYKQNIMFRTDGHQLSQQTTSAEQNYLIQRADLLQLEVYTNKGEKVSDEVKGGEITSETAVVGGQGSQYLVTESGFLKVPMIDSISVVGLTIRQAETILENEYKKFYVEPFVKLSFLNKRVIVLGASGGVVVPLANENMRLTEILALSKTITNEAKAHNIRLLRGEKVFVADFSSVKGYLESNFIVEPGDIVYVEPVRRPFGEGLREYGSVISIITSIGTLVYLIIQANQSSQ